MGCAYQLARHLQVSQSYIDGLYTDEEIENEFVYEMPEELAQRFAGGPITEFDMAEAYVEVTREGLRPKEAIRRSMDQHVAMIKHASEDYWDAAELVDLLNDDVKFRVKQYAKMHREGHTQLSQLARRRILSKPQNSLASRIQ